MNKQTILAAIAGMTLATSASATIVTVFDGIAAGVTSFDTTVAAAGGTVSFDIWSGLSSSSSMNRGDYTITQNDGGTGSVRNTYGSMTGQVISIDPAGASVNTAPALDYFASGITFTFNSAVNIVGFEVGDWATCCHAPTTDLFMSFDGGAPIMVASATTNADGLFPSQSNPNRDEYEIFVAAADDTGDFTAVSFWGNGIGEVLYAGGQVRYSLVGQGSLPPSGTVPEPGVAWLLLAGLAGFAASKRKAKKLQQHV